ncbi:MAG: heavy-metal-associated domain-containing protein [Planctomycetes bacterium]|nr:heavy-metal-associated domain-containing protein [Planctomycetota bacterium]
MADEPRDIEFRVSGMHCDGCEQALSMVLRQHASVESVEADARSGTVRVTVRGEVDPATLKERIYSAGYDVE